MAEALYRKYRPQTFDDVVGQTHIERTIKNAIEADRVSHAYLFCGPRGTGKTTTARLLAKALLCEHGPTPCPDGTCQQCLDIAEGIHPDVNELDAASRTGVENVREEIINRVQFAPTRGRYKVYIIDEVHMLSNAAFNALLKTLEEPPSHIIFILCTTDPQKIPETILSRCQRFDFHRLSHEEIVSRLGAVCMAEGLEFEGEALDLIAHQAQGGMRDALTTLEQLAAFGGGSITLEVAESVLGTLDSNELSVIVRHIAHRDAAACFIWIDQYVETGADLAQFTRDLAEYVRNMYVLSLTDGGTDLGLSDSARKQAVSDAALFGVDRLSYILGVLGDVSHELRASTNPRLSFEIALTRMTRPESDLTLEALAARIEVLERALAAGTALPTSAVTSAATLGQTPVPAVASTPAPAPVQSPSPAAARAQAPVQAPAPAASAAPSVASAYTTAGAQTPAMSTSTVTTSSSVADRAAASAASAQAATAQTRAQSQSVVVTAEMSAKIANAAALQRGWQGTIAELKKQRAAYGALLLSAHVMPDENNQGIIIEFAPENSFAFNAVQKPDISAALGQALALVFGEQVPFTFSKGNRASGVASAPVAPRVAVVAPVPEPAHTPAPAPRVAQTPACAPAQMPTPVFRPAQASVPMPTPKPAQAQAPAVEHKNAALVEPAPWDDDVVPYDDIDAALYAGSDDHEPLIAPPAPPSSPFDFPTDGPRAVPAPAAANPAAAVAVTHTAVAHASVSGQMGGAVSYHEETHNTPAPHVASMSELANTMQTPDDTEMDAATIYNSLGASFEEVHE